MTGGDPMQVRPALPDELDRVGELTVRAYAADDGLGDNGYADRLRDAHGRAAHTEVLVAVDTASDQLVGAVAFALADSPYADLAHAGEAEFRMLAVVPEARGRGVAAALVGACLDRARAGALDAVVISTRDDARVARRLYERLGFHRDPDLDWEPAPGVRLLGYRISL